VTAISNFSILTLSVSTVLPTPQQGGGSESSVAPSDDTARKKAERVAAAKIRAEAQQRQKESNLRHLLRDGASDDVLPDSQVLGAATSARASSSATATASQVVSSDQELRALIDSAPAASAKILAGDSMFASRRRELQAPPPPPPGTSLNFHAISFNYHERSSFCGDELTRKLVLEALGDELTRKWNSKLLAFLSCDTTLLGERNPKKDGFWATSEANASISSFHRRVVHVGVSGTESSSSGSFLYAASLPVCCGAFLSSFRSFAGHQQDGTQSPDHESASCVL
jgi:hypothetical protein